MNSLAALFSFQGTDRPRATRRTSGAPVHETEISSYEKSRCPVKDFLALPGRARRRLRRGSAPGFRVQKILSREGIGIIRSATVEVKEAVRPGARSAETLPKRTRTV